LKKLAVIAQTIDPSRGSEFATGWSVVREIFFDRRILETYDVDIFVSENGSNRQRIERYIEHMTSRPNFVIVPQVWPKAHFLIGRVLRVLWQVKVCFLVMKEGYEVVHQVSPNSLAYLNPIFMLARRETRIVGPMRIEPKASVDVLYIDNLPVLFRQLQIRLKESFESFILLFHRRCVARRTELHLSPIAGHMRYDNQIYCRETAFIQTPIAHKAENDVPWNVIWSGLGDYLRKNEHLARRVVNAALTDPRLDELNFNLLGVREPYKISNRVFCKNAIPRDEFLSSLTSRTIYLCTSVLELNCVLAEEVLSCGGSVVCGPLPGFSSRPDTQRIFVVQSYRSVREWVEKLVQALETDHTPTQNSLVEQSSLVDEIIGHIRAFSE
jgi:hypothetical protein